jgi:glyoxylase-like metal-dependent hydrolase (beta-lactamase superfamily II)
MKSGDWVGVAFASVVVLLLVACISPAFRKASFARCFSLGYWLYTKRVPGYTLHKAFLMSSAEKPKTPHTNGILPTIEGEGDNEITVLPIALLGDNYSYLLLHSASKTAALVDPADPAPVLETLKQYPDYKLHTILTTHKHWDHAGGNLEMKAKFPSLQIVGGVGDEVAGATVELETGGEVSISSPSFKARVFSCPCHTRGHVVYLVGTKLLFTGDTLFSGGCGKFFEGNAGEMYKVRYRHESNVEDRAARM